MSVPRPRVTLGRAPDNDLILPEGPERLAIRQVRTGRYRVDTRGVADLGRDGDLGRRWAELSSGEAIDLGDFALELHPELEERGRRGKTSPLREAETAPAGLVLCWGERRRALSPGEELDVGAHPDNDLVIDDGFVSAFHCRLHHDGTQWHVLDLGSTNGTTVDGVPVGEAVVGPGARVGVGQAVLRVEAAAPQPHPATFGMTGRSAPMRRVFEQIRRLADAPEPVLVLGASGAGKEGVAEALHAHSSRASGPFVALNCAALAASLVESELFGHVKGAFTGATADKRGAFEAASGGTLFLDEVGELPLDLQPKLLRVLETRAVRRIGSAEARPVDARVVAATHRDLLREVEAKRFREDLFHRLFVLGITLPALRERRSDIPLLAERFLDELTGGRRRLSPAALDALLAHDWPGNVRELRHLLIRAVRLSDATVLDPEHLQFPHQAFGPRRPEGPSAEPSDERARIEAALRAHRGVRAVAARSLGMSKSTFYDKVRRLGIDPAEFTGG